MDERDKVAELIIRLRAWDHCWPARWLEGATAEAANLLEALAARLAEVEAERDDYASQIANLLPDVNREAVEQRTRAEAAESALARLRADQDAMVGAVIEQADIPDEIEIFRLIRKSGKRKHFAIARLIADHLALVSRNRALRLSAAAALERVRQEAENRGLERAAEAVLPQDDLGVWRGSWFEPALREAQSRIRALTTPAQPQKGEADE